MDRSLLEDAFLAHVTGGHAISGYQEYTVQRGDTVDAIAERHHVSVREIERLNALPSASKLYLGQILRIPVRLG